MTTKSIKFVDDAADALVSTGLAKLGYRYVNIGLFIPLNL